MRSFALHKIMVALLLMVGVVLFAAGVSDSDSGYLVGVGLAAVLFAMVYGLLIIIASDINEVLDVVMKWMAREGIVAEVEEKAEEADGTEENK